MSEEASGLPGVPGRNGGRLSRAGIGRTPGVPNKNTRTIKAMYMKALDAAGGWKFFHDLATGSAEDKRTFAMIGARFAPLEVQGAVGEALTVNVWTYPSRDAQVPVQGTCVIEGNAASAPLPAPITAKTEVIEP